MVEHSARVVSRRAGSRLLSTAAAVLLAHNLSLSRATAQPPDKMDKAVPYGRDVLLTGRLVMRTFAGPPGYSSVAKGDRAERVPVLELDHQIRVSHPHFPRENPHTLRRIQLSTARHNAKEQASLDKLIASAVGQKVVVIADLWSAMTFHHHTAVMGSIQQLKLKGSPDFPAMERSSPEEVAAAEAKEVARLEQLLKDKPPAEFGPIAQFYRYTRLRGTLVERRLRAASSEDGWVDDGTKICWVLQLDHPITISASQWDGEITDVRRSRSRFAATIRS
jgi:hypothetical protein